MPIEFHASQYITRKHVTPAMREGFKATFRNLEKCEGIKTGPFKVTFGTHKGRMVAIATAEEIEDA